MSELPKGWLNTNIGEVTTVVAGGTPKAGDKSNFAESGHGIAWLTPADLSKYNKKSISHGSRDLSEKGLKSSSAKLMPKGTILFSSRAPIGYTVIAENEIATNQGFKNFVLPEGLDSSYTFYYLKSIKQLAESMGTGTTFKELSGAVAKTLPFVLAPQNEQIRIANKLDSMLAKVDAAQARLDKIPHILKRFRQSVLAAATSGELTNDNSDTWNISPLANLLSKIADCPHSTPKWTEEGKLCVRTTAFKPFYLDLKGQKTVSQDTYNERTKRLTPKAGDILYSREGAILGIACQIPEKVELCLGQRMVVMRAGIDVDPRYLTIVLNAPVITNHVKSLTIGNAAPRINMSVIKEFGIPHPTFDKQKEIARRVESLFTMADTVEKQFLESKARTNRLTQSILAKAFRGELLPQDPNDEPASELLARIKAEQAKLNPVKTKKKTKVA